MDKVMEWLRSSRTFDRAPTGRIPTSEERMTERQRIEHAIQKKIEVNSSHESLPLETVLQWITHTEHVVHLET